jgi:hypothetical protein
VPPGVGTCPDEPVEFRVYHTRGMGKQKRHHYLSASYLEGFSDRNRVWVYDREQHHYRHQLTREVAFRNYFYSFRDSSGQRNDAIERLLGAVESKALPLIRELREQRLLRPDERWHVALFLAYLKTRVPEFHAFVEDAHQKMARSTLKRVEALRAGRGEKDSNAPVYYQFGENSVMVPIEDLRNGAAKPMSREASLRTMLSLSHGLANALAAANWAVLKAPKDASFLTSDDPVVPLWPKRTGFYPEPFLTVTKLIPLATDTALLANMEGAKGAQIGKTLPRMGVREVNLAVAASSISFVIARDRALLESIVSKAKLYASPQPFRVTVS